MRSRIIIAKETLQRLYFDKQLSTLEIGHILGCNRQTISNYLIYFGFPKRSPAQARIRYNIRKDFSGDPVEQAYLVGFRLGDLNVYKPSLRSETIVVRCHSTTPEQSFLMESLFQKYGKVTISKSIYGNNINCFLNTSFSFLLLKDDNIPNWVYGNQSTMSAFVAGYVDAEGTFQMNQGRGRFALSTCDKKILEKIHIYLRKYDILSIYKKVANKGQRSIGKYNFNNDVWRININEINSLYRFINSIKPYLRHKKRIKDMEIVLQNISSRKVKKIC